MNGLLIVDGQTCEMRQLNEREARIMETLKAQVLSELADLAHGKTLYDHHFTWWAKHVFGDLSFAHEVFKKAARAASLVQAAAQGEVTKSAYTDTLDDCLLDLLNFTVMWLSWRRYKEREVMKDDDETGSHRTEGIF